ncbi:hypothetical protein B296_00033949 [Ensete ventricosum]|uniref:Kinesin motor domain-containing protein n=1 Tax=Ensete ventricosum TaxID=4639 RepID=A0A427A822_ENSVE|nr:hypothetical protein B296_00033949 [Ensete ventricosum]
MGALVKSSNDKIKTTPAGEYLTAALADFDPDQFESFAAISDGANKLLMLVSPVERFLEKANNGRSRSSSRGSSPGRSLVHYDSSARTVLADEQIHGFKETWRQHVTGGKLREITEEAKFFAIGNKALAALFVHTPAGELQRQIRSWLAENYDFLSVAGVDAVGGTTAGQLELLSTAIMDGWMAGLGTAQPPSTLATEEAEDLAHVSKLRSALESVDHKRKKNREILQQMRSDTALLTKEEGGSPIRNPSTAAEDARLASLISLDAILKQVKLIPEGDSYDDEAQALQPYADSTSTTEIVSQWNVLQFNTGSTASFIVKCGANSSSELVIKADARVEEPKGGEIIRVVPRPSVLSDMSFEDIKKVFDQLPEAISLLALARTADGTRARYSRLYRTLASKVPSLKDLVAELDKGGVLKDVRT